MSFLLCSIIFISGDLVRTGKSLKSDDCSCNVDVALNCLVEINGPSEKLSGHNPERRTYEYE